MQNWKNIPGHCFVFQVFSRNRRILLVFINTGTCNTMLSMHWRIKIEFYYHHHPPPPVFKFSLKKENKSKAEKRTVSFMNHSPINKSISKYYFSTPYTR